MRPIYKCVVCGKYVEEDTHCGQSATLLIDGACREQLSRLISYLLRHGPEDAGVRLDREGWARLDELVEGIKGKWRNARLYSWLDKEHVVAVATLDPKGRFELDEERIRCRYGHSRRLQISIRYPVDLKVATLYHGTTIDRYERIRLEGLRPLKRKFVHLTVDPGEACRNASRWRAPAILLVVDGECLRSRGLQILYATRLIRLVEFVPPECIVGVRRCQV